MRTLFTGGRIHGGAATSLVVEDGVITWLGPGDPPGPARETVDLAGALVAPAFVDAHVHATSAGLLHTGLDLTRAACVADVLDAVRDRVRAEPGVLAIGHGLGRDPLAGEPATDPRGAGRGRRHHAGVPDPCRRALRALLDRAGRPGTAGTDGAGLVGRRPAVARRPPRRPPRGPRVDHPRPAPRGPAGVPHPRRVDGRGLRARVRWAGHLRRGRLPGAARPARRAAAGGRLLGRVRQQAAGRPRARRGPVRGRRVRLPHRGAARAVRRRARTPRVPATWTRSGSPSTWSRARRPVCRPAST